MTIYTPGYRRAVDDMLRAGQAWQQANPGALPRFTPLGYSKGTVVFAELTKRIIRRTAGDRNTRALLTALAAAVPDGASVLMAEGVIEFLFGIDRALTVGKTGVWQ